MIEPHFHVETDLTKKELEPQLRAFEPWRMGITFSNGLDTSEFETLQPFSNVPLNKLRLISNHSGKEALTNKRVLDVGANIGYFSLLAASTVGDAGAVFAFEPDPANFALLQASAGHNGLDGIVHARCAGLAEKSGEAMLYLSRDNLGDHQIFEAEAGRDSVAIELLNGAEYLGPRTTRLDLVKVDTQGSEYGVIAGLMPLLQSLPRVPDLIVELTPLSLRQCGSSGRQLIELLAELGQPFHIVDHIEHRLVSSSADELALWCDNVDAVTGDAGFMNILVGKASAG